MHLWSCHLEVAWKNAKSDGGKSVLHFYIAWALHFDLVDRLFSRLCSLTSSKNFAGKGLDGFLAVVHASLLSGTPALLHS